jgi:hypothetical protein
VTDSDKEFIEKLKELVSKLETEQRLKSVEYIQKLQEEWFDSTERTRVIIDFETYLDINNIELADEIINVLESLLVK